MQKKALLALLLVGCLLSLVWLASSQSTASKSLTKAEPSTAPSMPSKEAVSAKLATLERGWVKNEGQWDERALFSAPGYFGNTWITKDGELLHVAVSSWDVGYSIALDSDGNVYVTGDTTSSDYKLDSNLSSDSNLSPQYRPIMCTLYIDPTPEGGTVTSRPAGINCGSGGSACSQSFVCKRAVVTLTATPDTRYGAFTGWTGDCSSCGTSTTCTINMDDDKTCSANFGNGVVVLPLDSNLSGGGSSGRSVSGGGSGSGGCSMTGSASSVAGLWNILVWLSVPAFVVARRIRRR
jgi:uncharacterized repeat protein (TIGR02543 family)